MCDSVTGYCLKYFIYSAKDVELSTGHGFTYNIVNKLLNNYINKDHVLYTDNFYTSIKLAKCLLSLGSHLVGTLRKNSKLFPKLWHRTMYHDEIYKVFDDNGNVAYRWRIGTKWDPHILSTITDGRDISTPSRPGVEPIIKPDMVLNYTKFMGGVDKFDQLRNYYPVGHHTKKWCKVLFFNLLDMAITNAYICYKNKHENVKILIYKKLIVNQLFGNVDIRRKQYSIDEPTISGPAIVIINNHRLVNSGKFRMCMLCEQENRKTISNGSIRSKYRCIKCNKAFCGFAKRDCFVKYHNNL